MNEKRMDDERLLAGQAGDERILPIILPVILPKMLPAILPAILRMAQTSTDATTREAVSKTQFCKPGPGVLTPGGVWGGAP